MRVSDGLAGWSVEKQELAHVAGSTSIRVRVTDNFGESAARAGVTLAQVAQLQRIFSAEVDLLTDLAAGDEVSLVLPEKHYLDGHVVQGRMAAARVVLMAAVRSMRTLLAPALARCSITTPRATYCRERFWRNRLSSSGFHQLSI